MQIILNTKDITNKTLYIDIAKNIIYNNLNSFISNLLLLKKIYVSEDFIKTLIKPKLKENYNDYKEISDKTLELYRKNNINIDQYINKIKTNFIKTLRLEYIKSLFGKPMNEKITFTIKDAAINFDKTYIQQNFINNNATKNYGIFSNKNVSFEDLCFLFCTGFNKYCILALLHLIQLSDNTLFYYTSMTKIQSAECIKSTYKGTAKKQKYFLEHLCLDLKCKKCSNKTEKQHTGNQRFNTKPPVNNRQSVYKTRVNNQTTAQIRQEEREKALEEARKMRKEARKAKEEQEKKEAMEKEEEKQAKIKRYKAYVKKGTKVDITDKSIQYIVNRYISIYKHSLDQLKVIKDLTEELNKELNKQNVLYHREVHLYF